MATVVISHDPSGITKKEMFQVDGCVIEWLVDRYKDGFKVPTKVFLNTPSNEIDLREYPYGLVTNDVVIVAHQPAGGAEALINPFVWIPATIDYIKSLAPIEPSFDAPENFDTGTAGSPNNKINGQTNTIRLYEKIPQVYGTFKSYPDTIIPSYGIWVNNEWILAEYFMISDGIRTDHTISEVRRDNSVLFNENISILPPSVNIGDWVGQNNGWAVYNLFPNDWGDIPEFVRNVRKLSESVGLDLRGANVGGDTVGLTSIYTDTPTVGIGRRYTGSSYATDANNITFVIQTGDPEESIYNTLAYAAKNLNAGDIVTLEVNSSPYDGGKAYTIKSTSQGVDSNLRFTNIEFEENLGGVTGFLTGGDSLGITGNTILGFGEKEYGPFRTPLDSDGVYIDIATPNGLITNSGGTYSATLQIRAVPVGGGTTLITNRNITSSSRTPRNITYDVTLPSKGIYDIYIKRTTSEDLGTNAANQIVCDAIKPYQLLAPITEEDTTKTTLLVKTKVDSASIRSGKVNCIYGRPIPIFNYTTRIFDTQAVTSRFDLILMHHMVNVGGVPLNQINTDDLEEIVAAMPLDLIQYNGTLAGKNTPLDNDIAAICGAARVSSYKQGSMYRFYGDYAKPVTMVFGITDKEPNADNKTIQMRLLNDFDGIELEFKNAANDYEPETIYIPEIAVRRKKIDGVGMTSYTQALSRANYEYARLRYQRTSFKTTVTNKGIIPDLGDVVRISDDTRADSVSAEVLSIDGNSIFVSEKINAPVDSNGKMLFGEFSIDVRVRGDYELLWLIGSPANLETRGQNGNQKGTTVIFVSSGDIADYPKWMITNKKYSGQSVDLECVNYNERLYDGDS